MKEPKHTGFIENPFDPRDVWEDELGAAEEEMHVPEHFKIEGLEYDYQGFYPFCVSFACTTAAEWFYKKTKKVNHAFSQPHPFFHAGGSETGSYFRAVLNVLVNNGAISYPKMKMPKDRRRLPEGWHANMKSTAMKIPFTGAKKIPGYMRINPDEADLKRAILNHGPILVGVRAIGDYYSGNAARKRGVDTHAVLLVGWDATHWIIFDSLNWVRAKNGYGTVKLDYRFYTAYALTGLPRNWKKKRDDGRRDGFEHCLNHYGKPRDFEAEQRNAAKLLEELKKFKNQSVLEAAGRFWTVLVNAVTYGGYSISYRKWGRWQPGDVINDIYHWRRTNEHIFDFNKLRSEHE